MSEDLSKKVLEKIECEKICPTPKWCFVCKDAFLWILLGVCTLAVSLAFSLMIFLFISHDWDVYQLESGNLLRHILIYTPYLWIVIFLLLILLVSYSFGKTKDGYKYNIKKSVGVFVLIILFLSVASVLTGISALFQDSLKLRVPMYKSVIFDKYNIWDEPQKGLLAGRVTKIKDKNNFDIKDFNQDFWHVKEQNTKFYPPNFSIDIGKNIKMIGHICSYCPEKNTFIVTEIKPW